MFLNAMVTAALCAAPAVLLACPKPLASAPQDSAFQAQMVLETATGLRVINTVAVEPR